MINSKYIYDSDSKIPYEFNGTTPEQFVVKGDTSAFPYKFRLLAGMAGHKTEGPKIYAAIFSGDDKWKLYVTEYFSLCAQLLNISDQVGDPYDRTRLERNELQDHISKLCIAAVLVSGRYPSLYDVSYAVSTGQSVTPQLLEWYNEQSITVRNRDTRNINPHFFPNPGYRSGPHQLNGEYDIQIGGQKHPRSTVSNPIYQSGWVFHNTKSKVSGSAAPSQGVEAQRGKTPEEIAQEMLANRGRNQIGRIAGSLPPDEPEVVYERSNKFLKGVTAGLGVVVVSTLLVAGYQILNEKNAADTGTDDEPTPTTITADQPEATPGTKGETWMDRGIDAVKGGIDTVTGAVSDAAQTVTGEEKPSQPIDICRTDVSDGLAPRREPIIDPSTKLPFVGTLYNTKIPVRAYVKDGSGNTFAEVYVRDLVGAEVAKRQGFKPEDKVYIAARLADGSVYCVSTGEISRLNSTIASLTNEYKNQKLSRGV